jgi:hypothetical protein
MVVKLQSRSGSIRRGTQNKTAGGEFCSPLPGPFDGWLASCQIASFNSLAGRKATFFDALI